MWETLKPLLNTSATRSGRTTLLRQFRSARPTGTDYPITEYFRRLLHCRQQLHRTNDQISDDEFRTHIYTTIPDQFAMTIEVLMGRAPEPSEEDVNLSRFGLYRPGGRGMEVLGGSTGFPLAQFSAV